MGGASGTRVAVYSIAGNLVREVENRQLTAGRNTVTWDGRDDDGKVVRSGIYIVVVESTGQSTQAVVGVMNR